MAAPPSLVLGISLARTPKKSSQRWFVIENVWLCPWEAINIGDQCQGVHRDTSVLGCKHSSLSLSSLAGSPNEIKCLGPYPSSLFPAKSMSHPDRKSSASLLETWELPRSVTRGRLFVFTVAARQLVHTSFALD